MIHLARNCKGRLSGYLKRYRQQPKLTAHLDNLPNEPFSQETINEIVLWKVNRYAGLPRAVREALHLLRTLSPKQHSQGKRVLLKLLGTHGVDLPMASTILRFQNADVFQIIDRHAYRAAMGKPYALYSATAKIAKVSVYLKYLDALHALAATTGTAFRDLDRILYVFDKEENGPL